MLSPMAVVKLPFYSKRTVPNDGIEFILREPKKKFEADTVNWGMRPLVKIRHGHYGLGLYRARSIFEKHHGNLRAEFDPSTSFLVTTVTLPLRTA